MLEEMERRLDQRPDAMRIRRQTVEHPFDTIKSWMGWTHFLCTTLEHAKTEMSVHVFAYNMKRMLTLLGVQELMAAIRA